MVCFKCGCTEEAACPGGCYWTRVSCADIEHQARVYVAGEIGICSRCDDGRPIAGFMDIGHDDEWVDDLEFDPPLIELPEPDAPLILPGDPEYHL